MKTNRANADSTRCWVVLEDADSLQASACIEQLSQEDYGLILVTHDIPLENKTKEMLNQSHTPYVCLHASGYEAAKTAQMIKNLGVSVYGVIYHRFLPQKARMAQLNQELLEENYQKNIQYPFFLIQELAKIMADDGRIIWIGSIHDEKPTGEYPLFSMTMGAIKNLSRELAVNLGVRGITSNVIEIGVLEEKPFVKESSITTFYEGYIYKIPCGKTGSRAEVAALCSFLLSPAGRFINGTQIRMDGGQVLHNVDGIANQRAINREGQHV